LTEREHEEERGELRSSMRRNMRSVKNSQGWKPLQLQSIDPRRSGGWPSSLQYNRREDEGSM